MKVKDLIAYLEGLPDKNKEVFANHNVFLGDQGWHKTASKVREALDTSGAVILDTEYTEIKKDVIEQLK